MLDLIVKLSNNNNDISKHICSKNCLNNIESVYNNGSFITVGDNIINKNGNEYNLTYGELTNEGMKNIINYLNEKNTKADTFIDLGCGNGKTLAYAIYNGFNKAKGVELVKERYDYAIENIPELDSCINNKIYLMHNDIFNLDKDFFEEDNYVIFISNLLFPEETTEKLLDLLYKNTPDDTIIMLSKIPDNNNLYGFSIKDKINAPMSWSSSSELFVLSK